jgi:PelA/Pel-15E family pectate lyase
MITALALLLAAQDADPMRDEAARALQRAVGFFRTKVARQDGYGWFVSADLARRFGETEMAPDQVWVQPPGTPSVGLAYLRAWEATRDPRFLEAATETAVALARGQLQSGGWTAMIDYAPGARFAYRNGPARGRNTSSLDDDQTTSVLRFLLRLDRALGSKDGKVKEALSIGLDALRAAQFPNGGFPQVWTGPAEVRAILPAKLPDGDWRELPKVKEYWFHYTINDGSSGRIAALLAEEGSERSRQALARLGDFLVLAQLPEPQPAWAQQYDAEMRPAWARKFEPPAVTGGESQDAMEALIFVAEALKEPKYLEPVARAIAYLRKSLLADGRLARFYELKTNRPLWLNTKYEVVYTDDDLPTHYGFKVASRLDRIEQELDRAKAGKPRAAGAPSADRLRAAARKAIDALDAEGRWVEVVSPRRGLPEGPWIRSETFVGNVEALCRFLEAK